jgi:hypothetical protein
VRQAHEITKAAALRRCLIISFDVGVFTCAERRYPSEVSSITDYQMLRLAPSVSHAAAHIIHLAVFISRWLRSIFSQRCAHAFSWPHLHPAGSYYQVCVRCGDLFAYDWGTMVRCEKIATAVPPESSAALAKTQIRIPRSPRLQVRRPIFFRELGHSQYGLAMIENISKSGILFECQTRPPEGTTVEIILEMPEEISGQPNKHVICRGEVMRTTPSAAGTFMVGVVISGYTFLTERP